MNERILVTGDAGFIGFHFAGRLLDEGYEVVGVDNLNPYYDVSLKQARLERLRGREKFSHTSADISDQNAVAGLFREIKPDRVVNLAAQAGVRYSLTNPHAYLQSNLAGFLNILEGCRHSGVKHLVYASSSSVYGSNTKMPFSVHDNVDHPISLYAASKKANELMAHTYSHLYRLPTTGLRFFTVYGPWGRPDMALFIFTKAILEGRPIDLFNQGQMRRDFTYIDDIVEGIFRVMKRTAAPAPEWDPANPDTGSSSAPYRLYNIGNHEPVELVELIRILEASLGRRAETRLLPMQPGDVPATYADVDDLARDVGFRPRTSLAEGVGKFVQWYREYYGSSHPAPSAVVESRQN